MTLDDQRRQYLAGLPTVHVCAGPPACLLQGKAASENISSGCPTCKRIAIHPDGSETVYHMPTR